MSLNKTQLYLFQLLRTCSDKETWKKYFPRHQQSIIEVKQLKLDLLFILMSQVTWNLLMYLWCFVLFQDPSVTQVTNSSIEPVDQYNPFPTTVRHLKPVLLSSCCFIFLLHVHL